MSALAHKLPHRPSYRPHLQLVPLPAGEIECIPPHVYRRRRVIALLVVGALLLGAASLVSSAAEWAWERATTDPGGPVSAATQSTQAPLKEWTVRPGDTLWAIARSMQPQGDIRPVLDELTTRYQNRPLQIGETIVLP